MIKILLWGKYKSDFNRDFVMVPASKNIKELLSAPQLLLLPKDCIVAVNHQIAGKDTVLFPGDEIAIFPPVSGG